MTHSRNIDMSFLIETFNKSFAIRPANTIKSVTETIDNSLKNIRAAYADRNIWRGEREYIRTSIAGVRAMRALVKEWEIKTIYKALRKKHMSRNRALLCDGGVTWAGERIWNEYGSARSCLMHARMYSQFLSNGSLTVEQIINYHIPAER